MNSTFNSSGPFSVFLLDRVAKASENIDAVPMSQEADALLTPIETQHRILSGLQTPSSRVESGLSEADLTDAGIPESSVELDQEHYSTPCRSPDRPEGNSTAFSTMQTLQDIAMPEHIENDLGIASVGWEIGDTQLPASASDKADANTGFLNLEVKHLLRNYASNVLHIFSPLDTLNNTWRRFHLSHALQCSIELEILGHSAPSRRALLYTVLTISAYNLRNIPAPLGPNDINQYWGQVAARYKCKALNLLETCIRDQTTSLSNSVYNELLAAMLCMVTIDVCISMAGFIKFW